jgi:hypothetical protein
MRQMFSDPIMSLARAGAETTGRPRRFRVRRS